MSRTLEDKRGRPRGNVVLHENVTVWNPEARVTIRKNMNDETCYHVMELLSDPL